MSDYDFFKRAGPFSLAELADIGEADLRQPDLGSMAMADVAPLDKAGGDQVSFLDNRKYLKDLRGTQAGAVVLAPGNAGEAPAGVALLVSPAPYRSFALISQAFYPKQARPAGIHAAASVAASARIGEGTCVEAGAVIGEEASIGAGCIIGANTVVADGVTVGDGTRTGPNVSLEYCHLGRDVQIHAGARIGTRGFGFAMDPRGHVELPQTGRVLIGNDVEIGANTTIDRGMGPDTVIGDGCKIDNLVQIGHNVVLGKNCVVAALSGLAGSAKLEDFVICAAKVGIAGHLTIGAGTRIAAMSGITKSVPAGSTIAGVPAGDHRDWLRKNVMLNRMVKDQG